MNQMKPDPSIPVEPYNSVLPCIDEAHKKLLQAAGAIVSDVCLADGLEQVHRFRGSALAVQVMAKAEELRALRKLIVNANDVVDPPF